MYTGSLQIKSRKKGDIYYAVINLGKNGYKWINLNLPVKNNKKLAQQKLQELIIKYNENLFDKIDILFIDYIKNWLEGEKSQVDIITLEGYRQYAIKHIIPYFEPKKLNIQNVTISHLEEYYNYKSKGGRLDNKKGGLSNRTIKLHSIVLNLIFKDALYKGIIKDNPNLRAKIPKNNDSSFKGNFYSVGQCNELLKSFEGMLLQDMIYLTIIYGLRRSELMGLKWQAVDFENDTLMIQHTVVLNETVVAKDKTKNKSSNRCYPLLPDIKEILLNIKTKQIENKKIFGNCYNDNDYIFTHEDGNVFHPSYCSHMFRKKLNKSDIPTYRWHDLRHSTASILLAKGWSMKDISEWLGHCNINVTMNTYTHIDVNRKRELSKGLESMLH
jgi:integrase